VAAAAATAGVQDSAWNRFVAGAEPTPAVQDLIDQYTTADQEGRTLGARLVASNPGDPDFQSNLATEQAMFEHEADVLQQLRRIYVPLATGSIASVTARADGSRFWVLTAFGIALVVTLVASVIIYRNARQDERRQTQARADRAIATRRSDLETRLQRGLEMAPNEEAAFDVVNQALVMVGGDSFVEVLAADSSHAHYKRATATIDDENRRCAVGGPHDCPAASSGQSRVFNDSTALDACPFLRSHDPAWAMCVPISMAGRTTGVVHAEAPAETPPPTAILPELELVARKAGDRIGALRILARTESQAQLDPLTGLANRRNLERRLHEVLGDGSPYVVAFIDLDHFKALNDRFGHETGDRALRVFTETLRESVRAEDLTCRYGGEEFVVLLPGIQTHEAIEVMERVREELARATSRGDVPTFTASFGIAHMSDADDFDDLLERADRALFAAKDAGRDCICIDGHAIAVAPNLTAIN
jgi:diguanylate cyclase (GGDEF)-like protein